MWRVWVGLLLLATPVWAEENATAYEALRVLGSQFGRDALQQIVSIHGTKGDPQPEKWKIVVEDPQGRGVRELEIANGRIDSDNEADRHVAGSAEGATIDVSQLNLDSSGAYAVASHTAEKSSTPFATVSYTLRTGESGDPVWILTLQNKSSRPVGTIYIGANSGNVTRTEGLFAGANMNDVETERDAEREQDEEHAPFHEVRTRIRESFLHAEHEAHNTFERVKRSFIDFIDGD